MIPFFDQKINTPGNNNIWWVASKFLVKNHYPFWARPEKAAGGGVGGLVFQAMYAAFPSSYIYH